MKSTFARWISTIAIVVVLLSQFSIVPAQRAQAAAPWTPSSLGSSLAIWLDASDAATLTSSGGLVSEWRDKSGNARHAVQTSPSSQPTLNGSAVSISDYNRFMTGAMAAGSMPTSVQVTVVFTASGGGRNGYQSHPFTRTANNFPTPYDGYNDTLLVGGPTGSYAGFGGYADIRNRTTRTVLSTSMSATKVEQYLNGTIQKTDSGNYPYQDVPSIYFVGTRADRYTHFTGEINEIVVTNELSSSDRGSLESYLGSKWAVTGFPSAPTNSVAPVIAGTARTGQSLTTSTGTWTGSPTFEYQWKRANTVGGSYTDIASATNGTYVLTDSDIGKFIKVSVIATNGAGTASVLSEATSVVVDLPDSVVPTATTATATAAGFTFTILNYSNLYTYALTTTNGSVTRSTDDVAVTGLAAGASATVTIAVTRSNYKPASKTVTGSAIPAPTTTTTTTAAPALSIVIQAPVTTIAQGQASVATVAPTTLPVLGANGVPVPTTTSTIPPTRSKPVTTTLPRIVTTTTLGPPVVEKVTAGQTAVQVDGVKTDATVTRENNQMVVTAGSLSATMSSLDKTGKTSPLDSDGNIHLKGGDVIKISVGGFKPDSVVEVWLFSTPTKLGSVVVGADGTVTGAYRLPAGIKSGSHRVVVTARMANGKPTTFTLVILVGDISTTSTLTRVLIAIPISLAIGFGFLLPTQLRHRRRKKFSHA
jgi:hypothetical protein